MANKKLNWLDMPDGNSYEVSSLYHVEGYLENNIYPFELKGIEPSIKEYYDGLTITYKLPSIGFEGETFRLEINDLGAVVIKNSDSSKYSFNSGDIILLTFHNNVWNVVGSAGSNNKIGAIETEDTLNLIGTQGTSSSEKTFSASGIRASEGTLIAEGIECSYLEVNGQRFDSLWYEKIKHSDLMELVELAQLKPGCNYCITDYISTTTQENTRSVKNMNFDIVVKALDEKSLDENAKVIWKPTVSVNFIPNITKDDVQILYKTAEGRESVYAPKHSGAYEITYIDGIPAIYDTDPDTNNRGDLYIYKGTYILDQVEYNSWVLDEPYEGVVYGRLTNIVVEKQQDSLEWLDGITVDDVQITYKISQGEDAYSQPSFTDSDFVNELTIINGIPAFYDMDPDSEENGDIFVCGGFYKIDGVTYNIWWRDTPDDNGVIYGRLTNVVIKQPLTINTSSWEVKYCLYNDINRFSWADEENGRGVIYYMKDENGNEAGYDFKNIQFLRKLNSNGTYSENGTDTWCYTFGGIVDRSSDMAKPFNNNCIKNNCVNGTKTYKLPNNVLLSDETEYISSNNFFDLNCFNNTLSAECHENILRQSCSDIIINKESSSNTFWQGCKYIVINCDANNNIFENGCTNILFNLTNKLEFCKICTGVKFLNITTEESNEEYLKNITIHSGVQGDETNIKNIVVSSDANYYMTGVKEVILN